MKEKEAFIERRGLQRVTAKLPVRYQLRDSGIRGSSITADISASGTQILASEFLGLNKNLLLEFFLSEAPVKMINAFAKVIWSEQLPYTDRYRVGLEFNQINDEAKRTLSDFISSRTEGQA